MSAAAMANWAAGSSGVGPGVNKRVLRIIFLLVSDQGLNLKPGMDRLGSSLVVCQPQNTQSCGFCEFLSCANLPAVPNRAESSTLSPKSVQFSFGVVFWPLAGPPRVGAPSFQRNSFCR